MPKQTTNPSALLPLTQAIFHILLTLADKDCHGYAIIKEVEARTDQRLKLKPGTLYRAIHRLLEGGLIEEITDQVLDEEDDQRRRIYRLTDFGRKVVVAEAKRLEELVQQAHSKNIFGEEKTSPT